MCSNCDVNGSFTCPRKRHCQVVSIDTLSIVMKLRHLWGLLGWVDYLERRHGFCLSKSGFIARLCHLGSMSIKSWSSRNGVSDGSTKMWHPHVWGRSNDWPWCSSNSRRGLCLKNVLEVSIKHQFAVHDAIVSIGHCQSIELLQLFHLDSIFTNIYFQNLNLYMKT